MIQWATWNCQRHGVRLGQRKEQWRSSIVREKGGLTLLVAWLPPPVFRPIMSPATVASATAIFMADTPRDGATYEQRVTPFAPGRSGRDPAERPAAVPSVGGPWPASPPPPASPLTHSIICSTSAFRAMYGRRGAGTAAVKSSRKGRRGGG